ncbi:MAG: DUF1963 domain-containing protein [Deltaproteobacteria bacterium]|nr:DUF1963 domain-containing protein [Deltaproteobacteria bacterium]
MLTRAQNVAYADIYNRWKYEIGSQHGLFGYERPMECAQRADDIMLLRLDHDGSFDHDFIDAETLNWLVTADALEARDWSCVRAGYGRSI